MGTLLVAAGGGGDAIAAAALAPLAPGGGVGIATFAWDRLLIDPLPGPRIAADFTGLEARHGWWQVTGPSQPVAPAGSTLPRLAREIPFPLVLLDASGGARSIRRQIAAAADELGADEIRIVDVGGDVLGRPGDAGLRSPLADALTAASCLSLPSLAWVAGAGLDGELPDSVVVERCADATAFAADAALWQQYLAVLQWHPSEATALLASASLGTRGVVEIRDAGIPVSLTTHSAEVHELRLSAVCDANPLVQALADSESLHEAERLALGLLGTTELDVERAKAGRRREHRRLSDDDVLERLQRWDAAAQDRGIDYVTFRRLAEALGNVEIPALKALLSAHEPERA